MWLENSTYHDKCSGTGFNGSMEWLLRVRTIEYLKGTRPKFNNYQLVVSGLANQINPKIKRCYTFGIFKFSIWYRFVKKIRSPMGWTKKLQKIPQKLLFCKANRQWSKIVCFLKRNGVWLLLFYVWWVCSFLVSRTYIMEQWHALSEAARALCRVLGKGCSSSSSGGASYMTCIFDATTPPPPPIPGGHFSKPADFLTIFPSCCMVFF